MTTYTSEATPLTKNQGFTLLELMVTVGILAVVSSIAVSSYSSFITTSQVQTLNTNFESAADVVQNNYAAAKQHVSMGASVARYIPTNAQGWVDMLGSNDARAPEGGSAYIIGTGDDITGAIGIGMTGSYGGRDSVVTIYRPAYRGVAATSISFAQVDY